MDYSQLSDFEINKRVALAVGLSEYMFFDVDEACASGPVWTVPSGDYYLGLKSSKGNPFDPCSNAEDAFPIIHEHGISLAFDKNENEWVAWGDFAFDLAGWDMKEQPAEYQHDQNPLRAAMCVFLMQKEEEHA